jgi:hypothetical protein
MIYIRLDLPVGWLATKGKFYIRPLAKGAFEPKASVFLVGQGSFLSSYWASPDEKIAEGQPKNRRFGPNSLLSQEVYCTSFPDGQSGSP